MSVQQCTLHEIQHATRNMMFSVLHAIDNLAWQSIDQIVHCPLDEWALANKLYKKQNSKGRRAPFPFAALTRNTEIDSVEYGTGNRTWKYPAYIHKPDGTSTRVDAIYAHPVQFQFSLKIYDGNENGYEKMEYLIDRLIMEGLPSSSLAVDYDSAVLGTQTSISAVMSLPIYDQIPNAAARSDEEGYVYALRIPLKVTGLIGTRTADAKPILEVISQIFLSLRINAEGVPPVEITTVRAEGNPVRIVTTTRGG